MWLRLSGICHKSLEGAFTNTITRRWIVTEKLPLRTLLTTAIRSAQSEQLRDGFTFWPDYFTVEEQKTLLKASLHRLDQTESNRSRKKRRHFQKSTSNSATSDLQSIFFPDEYYEFEEGHFDGVIRNYREMHLRSWPEDEFEGLSAILGRLYSLCPSTHVQTHILHLATHGYIGPHIDNVHASGTWILGISLGNTRILCMEHSNEESPVEIFLPSGSVYMQSDFVRYNYKHSIAHDPAQPAGQRLSIMIRDLPKNP